jgi:hypothetical protein
MPPVILPKPTRETDIEVRELSWSKDMKPTAGGKTQRQDRLGTRHSFRFDIPVLRYGWCGAALAADLAVGRTGDGAAIVIPEPGIPDVDYGEPVANGSPQMGKNLNLRGITPGRIIPKGKWISLWVGGRYYAHFTTAQVVADGSGQAILPIYPMIRRSPLDGSAVIIRNPMVQGLISEPVSRKVWRAGTIALTFEIEEQE